MASTATPSGTKAPDPTLGIRLEFGGGLELLFSNKRSHRVELPVTDPAQPPDVKFLIRWMADTLLTDRLELFLEGDTVRPGILVLINDVDWELEGEGKYVLKENDEVVFISTLHGG